MSHRIPISRLGALAALAAGALALSACTASAADTEDDAYRIGYFVTGSSNSYQQAMIDGVRTAAEDLGVTVDVLESNFDVQTQNNQMELALQRKTYDAWILTANSGGEQCDLFREAAGEGIPIVLLVTDVCDGDRPEALSFVGVANEATYLEWWDRILGENDPQKLAVVMGPQLLDITVDTEKALAEAMEAHPGFTVASTAYTDYTTQQAFAATQDLLRANPDIELVATNFANLTRGVIEAIDAVGRTGEVKVYDFYGDQYIADQIAAGTVVATLPALPYSEGYRALQAIVDGRDGKIVEAEYNPLDGLEVPGGPFITIDNVAGFDPEY